VLWALVLTSGLSCTFEIASCEASRFVGRAAAYRRIVRCRPRFRFVLVKQWRRHSDDRFAAGAQVLASFRDAGLRDAAKDRDANFGTPQRVIWRRVAAGLAVVAGVLGVSSYFVPAPAVGPMRVLAAALLLLVGLYNFWRAMMEQN
jgi:hypothetical protein